MIIAIIFEVAYKGLNTLVVNAGSSISVDEPAFLLGDIYFMPNPTMPQLRLNIAWPSPFAIRLCLLLFILTAELLVLSVNFDNRVFSTDQAWWTRLASKLPIFLRIGLAFAGVFLLVIFPRLGGIFTEMRQRTLKHPWLRWLLSHFCVYGLFYLATANVFATASERGQVSGTLMGVWVCVGIANLLSWLLVVAPSGFWLSLIQRERWPLVFAALAGTLAWLGGLLAEQLWQPLAEGTFWLSHWLLGLVYSGALFDPKQYTLGTSRFSVQIAPECSGYEGISLVVVFLSLYLWMFRNEIRFPHAFWLFPVGVLAIWLANALRITGLIIIGDSFSPEIALGGFHSQAGWIGFIAISLGLIVASRGLHLFSKPRQSVIGQRGENIAEALLVPGLALMASMMLTSALSSGFDWLYPLRVIVLAIALWCYRNVYRQWDWSVSWSVWIIGIAVFALWMLLEPPVGPGATALENALGTRSSAEKSVWLVFRVVGSVFLVPVVEEMAFRGYLLRRLAGLELEGSTPPRFTVWSFCLSSLAFGLLHGRWVAGTLAGMTFACAYYRRGKLGDAIMAHLVANALIALSVLVLGKWSLWSS